MLPYPSWLNAGDNAWQLTAATLVGLMSLPGLAVLYGGLVQRKWGVNTMVMAFTGFSLVLIVWMLWGYKMGFGDKWIKTFVGKPGPVIGHGAEQNQANIPLLNGAIPPFRFPQSSLVYFQFVFAAITPLLFLGSVVGRMNIKAWLLFVPLWSTFAYSVNAFLLWGGGWWGHKGALDYSGGYVIHLAAGTSGFVAAATIGPRIRRDREDTRPNNLLLVGVGAGLLWLGWNGFNGGDPYFAGADAATAVLNTNLCTAVALMTWVVLDMLFGPDKKPTFLGAVNGMIVGLVSITPAAGYVNGYGALFIGLIASTIVWMSWNLLGKLWLFKRVDDAMGVVHTHGVAGLAGGLLVGLFADPHIIVYPGSATSAGFSAAGALYHHPIQLAYQAGAAGTIIVWDAAVTFILLRLIGLVVKLRAPEAALEIGDIAIHDEALYPDTGFPVGAGAASTSAESPVAAPSATDTSSA
jgi:ammonium transporter, Amt family